MLLAKTLLGRLWARMLDGVTFVLRIGASSLESLATWAQTEDTVIVVTRKGNL
jgi:hypothetical protein